MLPSISSFLGSPLSKIPQALPPKSGNPIAAWQAEKCLELYLQYVNYQQRNNLVGTTLIIKGCVHYIFASFKIELCETFLEFSDIQVSWRYQMHKHKTKNTFYWISLEVNKVLINFSQFMSYYKRKNLIKKLHKNCNLKTSSMPFCIRKELSTVKQATYIRYVLVKLSKFVQISRVWN